MLKILTSGFHLARPLANLYISPLNSSNRGHQPLLDEAERPAQTVFRQQPNVLGLRTRSQCPTLWEGHKASSQVIPSALDTDISLSVESNTLPFYFISADHRKANTPPIGHVWEAESQDPLPLAPFCTGSSLGDLKRRPSLLISQPWDG